MTTHQLRAWEKHKEVQPLCQVKTRAEFTSQLVTNPQLSRMSPVNQVTTQGLLQQSEHKAAEQSSVPAPPPCCRLAVAHPALQDDGL